MTHNLTNQKTLTEQAKNAIRYSWIILGAGAFSFFGGLMSLRESLGWQNFVNLGAGLFLMLMAITANLVARRNLHNLAGFCLMFGGLSISVTSMLVIAGIGMVTGIVSIVMTVLISTQILERRYQLSSFIAGGLVSIYCLVMELLLRPAWRLTTLPPKVVSVLLGVMIVTIGFFLVRKYHSLSLRLKMMIAFLGISLTAVISVTILANLITRQALTRSMGAQLKNNSVEFAHNVGNYLNQYIVSLRTLAMNDLIEQSSFEACSSYPTEQSQIDSQLQQLDQQWIAADQADNSNDPLVASHLNNYVSGKLHEYQADFPDQIVIFTTDCYGGLIGTTNRTSDYLQADESWWQATYNNNKGDIYISAPEYDESANTVSLLIGVPIHNPKTGQITGILRSTVRLDALVQLVSTSKGTQLGTDILFIGTPTQELHTGGLVEVDAIKLALLQNISNKSYQEANYYGIKSLLSVAPIHATSISPYIDKLGWLVITHQNVNEALAPVQNQTNLITLLAFVIVIVTAFIASLIGQALTRPITRLTEIAKRISTGELTTRADIKTGDEIERLATTFNEMTDQLQRTLVGLEQRITDRTRAIEASALVGRRLTTILDQSQLVRAVVEQLQQAFNYYHVQIYLYDPMKENLVMAGGTGEPGRIMLEGGHKIQHGAGLVGRASETGTVVLVGDTTQEPNWLPNPLLPETKSEIAVPILMGDEVLGTLDVQQNRMNGLTQQDSDLLQLIASQVAVALRNSRLYAEAQRRTEELAVLNEMGRSLTASLDVNAVIELVYKFTAQLMDATNFFVALYDDKIDEVSFPVAYSDQQLVKVNSHPLGIGLTDYIIKTAKPLLISEKVNDKMAELGITPSFYSDDEPALSWLGAPLIYGGHVLGVISVQSTKIPGLYKELDRDLLTAMASQASIAIENARTFTQTQRQAEYEAIINTISQRIQSTTSVENALQVAVRELGRALGASRTTVQLGLPQKPKA